jgi:hypothetical protein
MPNKWRETVDIKQYLNREGMSNQQVCLDIAAELKRHPHLFAESGLVEVFEDAAREYQEIGEEPEFPDYRIANAALTELHDYFDSECIWAGIMK